MKHIQNKDSSHLLTHTKVYQIALTIIPTAHNGKSAGEILYLM
jgi:hypothetical protein